MADEHTEKSKSSFVHPSLFEKIDGIIHVRYVTKEFLGHIKDLPVQPNDVIISSYPKAGTTWVSEILWQINFDGNTDDRYIGHRVPFFDEMLVMGKVKTREDLHDFYLKHPSRIFKLHSQFHEVPMGDANKAKYIYVARNPKDTAVSFYHHYRGFKLYKFDPDRTWDEFFDMFINNRVHYGSWFDHVLSWWAHRDDENVLFLKYEDMKKDLSAAVQTIAQFIGKSLSPELIERITKQTCFSSMSDGKGRYYDGDELTFARNSGINFIRKGQVGDWRNYFTEEQNTRFDKIYNEILAESGLQFEF